MARTTGLSDKVNAALGEEGRKKRRKALWVDRALSPWTPVVVLGIVFIIYTFIIELNACASLALQRPMQFFAVAMAVYFLPLFAMYILELAQSYVLSATPVPKPRRLFVARHIARELIDSVEETGNAKMAQISADVFSKLEKSIVELTSSMSEGREEEIDSKLAVLRNLDEKHLVPLRSNAFLVGTWGLAKWVLIALFVRVAIAQPFSIPSGSMIPTLEVGDRIFVNGFIYGVRIPFMNYVPFTIIRKPKRGDVIVFENPVDPEKDYIKRVVGIPGDVISIHENVVSVNSTTQSRSLENANYTYWDNYPLGVWESTPVSLWRESLDGVPHYVLQRNSGPKYDFEKIEVPAGHVFVMGDSRDNSLDSRFGLGRMSEGVRFVPYGNIKGKAMVVWFSLSHQGWFSSFFSGTGFRFDRMFQPVDLCPDVKPRD